MDVSSIRRHRIDARDYVTNEGLQSGWINSILDLVACPARSEVDAFEVHDFKIDHGLHLRNLSIAVMNSIATGLRKQIAWHNAVIQTLKPEFLLCIRAGHLV